MKKTILVVGAHPDDIEIGCGGTVRNHVLKGDDVYYAIATDGEIGGDGKKRMGEALVASREMGVKDVVFLGLPDSNVLHNGKSVGIVDAVFKKIKPSIVYTHSIKDTHQDHLSITKAVLSASRGMKNSILCYESPSSMLRFNPIAFFDISDTFDMKVKCASYFVSQGSRDYLEREMMASIAVFRGKIVGVKYAEAFEVMRLVGI